MSLSRNVPESSTLPAGSYHYSCSKLPFLQQNVSRKLCELFACLPFIKPARVIWIQSLKLTHARR